MLSYKLLCVCSHAELHTTLCVQSWQSMVGTVTTCWCVVCFCFYIYLIYYYVWCWRGTNHYPLYVLSYMLSYILLCVWSLGRLLLVPVLRVGVSISICLHHYVWCWRGPNHYPLYVLSYMWCLATTLCVQSLQIIVGTSTMCWYIVLFCVYFYLFIPLCVVLKGSKPLPSIRTKLHAELQTTLCVQSWQSMDGTGTTCWCKMFFNVYFYLLIPLCVVLKGSKPLPSIRTKQHA
jgi:hypothetical protein